MGLVCSELRAGDGGREKRGLRALMLIRSPRGGRKVIVAFLGPERPRKLKRDGCQVEQPTQLIHWVFLAHRVEMKEYSLGENFFASAK